MNLLHSSKPSLSLHPQNLALRLRCAKVEMESRRLRTLWIGLVLLLFIGSTWAGNINPSAPLASQQATRGGYQDSQEQIPGPVPPQLETLVPPGANVLLGMGNNEPAIAVDPRNPLNVAVATYLGIRVSTNGGVSLQPRVNITAPAGYSTSSGGDSSVGYDSQGRLFWTFLLLNTTVGGFDVFVVQCNPNTGAILPGYPVNVTVAAGVPDDGGVTHNHDKPWLAVDSSTTSPFRDRLYVVWTDFQPGGSTILTSFSADQGANWSGALTLSAAGEGFVWPSQNTVAPNGDVYAAYHSQPTYTGTCGPGGTGCNPDGTSGRIYVLRSINAGASYPQKNTAFAAGAADTTFNVQSGPRTIPNAIFWTQGSVQPRILADPLTAGRIYVIANDQPNAGDLADVDIVISTNNGNNWSAPAHVDSGAAGTFQVMPSAAIDPVTGCIVVTYYDNRNNATNAAGNFLLDVFATTSANGGATFTPDFQINTASFDPDLNAPCRYGPVGCGTPDTVRTLRIGEYNGAAIGGGVALTVWTGNNASGFQDTVFNLFSGCVACTLNCPATVTQANDAGLCGATVNYPAPTTSGGCGIVTSSPPSGSFFPVGTTTVTSTSATGSSCTFNVIVNDTEPPMINCPSDITMCNDPGQCSAQVSFTVTATDNCAVQSLVCTPPSGSIFPKGTNTVTCVATDTSGNTTSCSFNVIVNDCEPPNVTSSVATASLWPPNHNLINVGLAASATDNCPGPIAISVQVFSDESEDAPGDGHFSPDAKDIAPGTLRLRSERFGDSDGRVYLIVTTATDASGNEGHSCATVVVPHDQSAASIASVNAQAAAASAYCAANNGGVPPGFVTIGIGPVIGPKQ
jgi:hypothetical protein